MTRVAGYGPVVTRGDDLGEFREFMFRGGELGGQAEHTLHLEHATRMDILLVGGGGGGSSGGGGGKPLTLDPARTWNPEP